MPRKTETVQIRQIAEKVGMSQSAVSIVLNGRGDEIRISKESQKKILETAKEMNYHPNANARRKRAVSNTQMMQNIGVFWNESFAEDAMFRYFKGIFQAVEKNQYQVDFMVRMFRNGRLSDLRSSFNSQKYSGILIAGISAEDLNYLNDENFDISVVVNRPSNKYSSVYVDSYEAGAECARIFAKKGFRTAGLLSANVGTIGTGLREMGFLNTCRESGIEVRDEWIVKGESMDMEAGYENSKRYSEMKQRPEGLYIMMDSLAVGAMMQFKGSDINIPEDMSIITYGFNPMLRHITPSVTMYGSSMVDTGENAINVLMTVLNNHISMPISKLIPLKFESGDSLPL